MVLKTVCIHISDKEAAEYNKGVFGGLVSRTVRRILELRPNVAFRLYPKSCHLNTVCCIDE